MKTDRNALESFLVSNAPDTSLVGRAMSAASPALDLIESGAYPLCSATATAMDHVPAALRPLRDGPFSLETISLTLPSGMNQEFWHEDIWRKIEQRITPWTDQGMVIGGGGTPLHGFLDDVFLRNALARLCPSNALRGSMLHRFSRCFAASIPVSAWCAATLPPHLGDIPLNGGVLRLNFSVPLQFLFITTLQGDAEAVSRLELLVRLLSQVVPLGMDANGRWLIPVR